VPNLASSSDGDNKPCNIVTHHHCCLLVGGAPCKISTGASLHPCPTGPPCARAASSAHPALPPPLPPLVYVNGHTAICRGGESGALAAVLAHHSLRASAYASNRARCTELWSRQRCVGLMLQCLHVASGLVLAASGWVRSCSLAQFLTICFPHIPGFGRSRCIRSPC
jgi:hypothetical protein